MCQRVLEEKDGVLSFIRVVDRFTVTARGKEVPAEIPPGQLILTAAMGWWGGLGKHTSQIRIVAPGGKVWQSPIFTVFLDSLERGQNIIANMTLEVKQEGLYWAEFLLNNKVKSRMPFRIIYERLEESPNSSSEEKHT